MDVKRIWTIIKVLEGLRDGTSEYTDATFNMNKWDNSVQLEGDEGEWCGTA